MALSKTQKARLASAADELARVKANIKQAEKRKAELEDVLKSSLPEGETTPLGDVAVEIRVTRSIDSTKIEKAFPVERFPDYYKLTVDTQAVKNDIAANKLSQYQKTTTSVYVKDNA